MKKLSMLDDDMPEDEATVVSMYEKVLDHLLTPAQVKEQLMQSQSTEKKWKTILMHKKLFDGEHATKSGGFGDKELSLLAVIDKAKVPDVQALSKLKTILSSANREMMAAFLAANGVGILAKMIRARTSRTTYSDLDVSILFEIMTCCKCTMNNSLGMEGFLAVEGAIEAVAQSLRFDGYRGLTVQVIEILSVCCFYSELAASKVGEGMRLLARLSKEAPFMCLSNALLSQDIEVKAAVLQFVNSMLMSATDVNSHSLLQNDLNNALFRESFDKATAQVSSEAALLPSLSADLAGSNDAIRKELGVRRKSLVMLCGPKAISEQKLAEILGSAAIMSTVNERGSLQMMPPPMPPHSSSGRSSFVRSSDPLSGIMMGELLAVKNNDKVIKESIWGGKRTKHRYYELDLDSFRWYSDASRSEMKNSLPSSSIVDVRSYSADPSLASKQNTFAFEIETSERVMCLACSTAEQKDQWVSALRAVLDHQTMMKGSFKLSSRELNANDVGKFFDMFEKQGSLYRSICTEHRRGATTDNGIDVGDLQQVMRFLQCETLASGDGDVFLAILQELLLIPIGARKIWEGILRGIKMISSASFGEGEQCFQDMSVTALLNRKGVEGGASYSQMSKLAMATLAAEDEVRRLKKDKSLSPPDAAAAVGVREEGSSQSLVESSSSRVVVVADNTPILSVAAPLTDERTLDKFVKMRKMLPEGAVRQKMALEGFNDAEIDRFFSTPLLPSAPAAVATAVVAPSAPSDDRYNTYEKMRKMLPEGALRQKMKVDGFSDADIDQFFNGSHPSASSVNGSHPSSSSVNGSQKKATTSLSPAEAIKFSKYDKLLKKSGAEAVRLQMSADGLAEAEVDRFFAASTSTSTSTSGPKKSASVLEDLPPEGMAAKPKITPTIKLKGLFWSKIKSSDISRTIWGRVSEATLPPEELQKLEVLFAAKVSDVAAASGLGKSASEQDSSKTKLLSVLEPRRAQNIMILLGKLRVEPLDVLKMVVDLDPEVLGAEVSSMIYEILPTPEELIAVRSFSQVDLLDKASQLLFHFNRLPRILPRVECHQIVFTWGAQASIALSQLGVIEGACKELQRSQSDMQRILAFVLSIGNYLNGGTSRGQAYGVQLDVFIKFANLKAIPQPGLPNESLLDFLVQQIELSDGRLIRNLSSDWVAVWAAADVNYKQLCSEINRLEGQVNKLNQEFILIKLAGENVGLDGMLEDARGPTFNPLYNRLNLFLNDAKPRIAHMKVQKALVEQQVDKEMQAFGESISRPSDDDSCRGFFSCIANFARALLTVSEAKLKLRLAQERELERLQNRATKDPSPANGTSGKASENKMKHADNLFGMFHTAQQASPDAVLAEFKMKMSQRAQLSLTPIKKK